MDKNQAEKFRDTIKKQCEDNGLWAEITEEYKPELRGIIIRVSIKVADK